VDIGEIDSAEGFHALEAEWDDLLRCSSANNVFLTWEWLSAWLACFGDDVSLMVIVVREGKEGRLLGVAPLGLCSCRMKPGLRFRELRWLSSVEVAPDHVDFVIRRGYEEEVAAAILGYLSGRLDDFDVLRLDGFSSDSAAIKRLLSERQRRGRHVHRVACPYIPLPSTWDEFRRRLPSGFRYNLGRYARKLERRYPGQVAYRQVASHSELSGALDRLFTLHQNIQVAKGNAGAFSDKRVRRFHRLVAKRFLSKGWLRFYFLTVAGADIAVIYCFSYGGVVSFYQSGFDPAWGRFGPGNQIMAYAAKQSIEEGAREFDLLRGAEPYKYNWGSVDREDVYVRVPGTLRGYILVKGYDIGRRMRRGR
jgi:CelD/BcsL family acetyltransferase involved in cellulose biosynthesis